MRKKAAKSKELPPALADNKPEPNPKFNLKYLKSEQEKAIKFQAQLRRPHRLFNQSEVLRAGIYALEELTPEQLKKVADSVPQL
jgi:hypothetical protein